MRLSHFLYIVAMIAITMALLRNPVAQVFVIVFVTGLGEIIFGLMAVMGLFQTIGALGEARGLTERHGQEARRQPRASCWPSAPRRCAAGCSSGFGFSFCWCDRTATRFRHSLPWTSSVATVPNAETRDTSPSRKRRWWHRLPLRLSVRALMVLVLIFAVWLGWLVRSARIQRNAVAAIERAYGSVDFDWQVVHAAPSGPGFDPIRLGFCPDDVFSVDENRRPWAPEWLVERLGPDYFGNVHTVYLGNTDQDLDPTRVDTTAIMAEVARLDRVECLWFDQAYRPVSEAAIAHVGRLTKAEGARFPYRQRRAARERQSPDWTGQPRIPSSQWN